MTTRTSDGDPAYYRLRMCEEGGGVGGTGARASGAAGAGAMAAAAGAGDLPTSWDGIAGQSSGRLPTWRKSTTYRGSARAVSLMTRMSKASATNVVLSFITAKRMKRFAPTKWEWEISDISRRGKASGK